MNAKAVEPTCPTLAGLEHALSTGWLIKARWLVAGALVGLPWVGLWAGMGEPPARLLFGGGILLVGFLIHRDLCTPPAHREKPAPSEMRRPSTLSERKKREFINTVTHELRSPVAVTLSLLRLVNTGLVGELSSKQAEVLARAERRVRALEALINDLLTVAECDAPVEHSATAGPLDLAGLSAEVVERYGAMASAKGQALVLDVADGGVYALAADSKAVDRVVDNLVSNAVKYTPRGGRIDVRLRERAGELLLEVEDTGIGIPARSQAKIGREFYRAANARRLEEHGTGLGLAIASRLMDRLNGRMELESEEGRGSRFTLRFAKN